MAAMPMIWIRTLSFDSLKLTCTAMLDSRAVCGGIWEDLRADLPWAIAHTHRGHQQNDVMAEMHHDTWHYHAHMIMKAIMIEQKDVTQAVRVVKQDEPIWVERAPPYRFSFAKR
eukprot:67219-Chlamydomonas_euryale.AAC.1